MHPKGSFQYSLEGVQAARPRIGVRGMLTGGTSLDWIPAGACPREGGGGNDANCTNIQNNDLE